MRMEAQSHVLNSSHENGSLGEAVEAVAAAVPIGSHELRAGHE